MSIRRVCRVGAIVCGLGIVAAFGPTWPLIRAVSDEKAPAEITVAAATPSTSAEGKALSAIGRRLPNFVLADPAGKMVGLADFRDKPYLVITFITCECPLSNQYLPVLTELQQKYAGKGVQFVAVNSQPGVTSEKIATHAKDYAIGFPVLCDTRQTVADILSASRTCETFVLDPQRFVRYQGRIDDRYQYTTKRDNPSRHDLAAALDELLANQNVSVKTTEVSGCLISRPRRGAPKGEITYTKQISRILQEKCQDCHHPNTAAPFSLLTYDDAVNWADMMRETVVQRRMPPWHADPRFGSFSEERRLSDDEIDLLVAWINDGTPQGDPQDAPATRDYPDGWRIGTPDVVFELPKEVTVPAKGTIPYMYFETPTNFKEDMWIEACEARPGNRTAVHHIVLFYKAPGDQRPNLQRNWIDGAAPGYVPMQLPEGIGRRIPAGASLIWQMHYTATGKVEKDRSQYAFKFCKQRPTRELQTAWIANQKFRIAPNDPNSEVRSQFTFSKPAVVYGFSPHMHVRGKDFQYKAFFPDGTSEVLLSVPQYDFNWHASYRLKEPRRVPPGTRVECVAHYDNSKGNPANPDPTKPVFWGDQTWEEMMIGYTDFVWDEPVR
ncbi:MAG TPA: redoxin domain-containing protein [Planctomycetaceae bacterium]|nr:redoxin domain-containing protein [Planctomycetaceae bacterium]